MDPVAPPPALDDVLKFGADSGASLADQAEAAKNWRDKAQSFAQADVGRTDPVGFFKGNEAVDQTVKAKIDSLRTADFQQWQTSNFDDQASYDNYLKAFNSDPDAAAKANPEATEQLKSIIKNPAYHFEPASNKYVPITGPGGTQLGSYTIQKGTDGDANVLVGIMTPDGKNFQQDVLKVPMVTAADLEKAQNEADDAFHASDEESRGSDSASVLGRALGFDPGGVNRNLEAKTNELKARSDLLDSPQGMAALQHERIMEAFNKSPLADQATQWGIGEDITRGFQNLRLGTQYAFANLFGSDDTEKKYREAINSLPTAYPGTTKPGDGVLSPQTVRGVAEMGGQLPALAIPYAGPALMGISTYGDSVAQARTAADAAEAQATQIEKQDPALAKNFRDLASQMRNDAQSFGVIQGGTMAIAGKLLPEAKTVLGNMVRSGVEFGGINAATGLESQAVTGEEFQPMKILEGLLVGGAIGLVHGSGKKIVDAIKGGDEKTLPPAEAKAEVDGGYFVTPSPGNEPAAPPAVVNPNPKTDAAQQAYSAAVAEHAAAKAEVDVQAAKHGTAEFDVTANGNAIRDEQAARDKMKTAGQDLAKEQAQTPASTTVQVNTLGLPPPPEPKAGQVMVQSLRPPGEEAPPPTPVEQPPAPNEIEATPANDGSNPATEPGIIPTVGEVPNGEEPSAGPTEPGNAPPAEEPPTPPVEPAKGPTHNPDEEVRLAHADEAAREVAAGRTPLRNVPQGTKDMWQQMGRDRFLAGDGPRLVASLNDHPRAPNPIEHYTLMHYAEHLESIGRDSEKVLADESSTDADRAAAGEAKDHSEAERERLAIAANRGGSAAGAALGVRAMTLKRNEVPTREQMIADKMKDKDPTYQTPLSDEERAQVNERWKRLSEKQKAVQESAESNSQAAAVDDNAQLLAEARAELEKTKTDLANALAPKKGEKPRFTKRVADAIGAKADEARKRLAAKGTQFNMSLAVIDPSNIRDYALIMADYIAKGVDAGARMIGEFGDAIKPHLADLEKSARNLLGTEVKNYTPDEVKQKFRDAQAADPDRQIGKNLAREIAKAHIREHIENNTPLSVQDLDRLVHNDLKEFAPDLTLTESRDLRTGYGKQSFPSDDPVDIRLRDLNRQAQLISSIERAEKKLRPLKSGPQRDKATAEVRELHKQLADVMAREGVETRDPSVELSSRREAIKNRLTNEIEDLDKILKGEAKARIDAPGFDWNDPKNKDLLDLRTHRDNLKKAVDAMPENVEASEKQKNAAALKAAQDAEKEWNRRAKELDFGRDKKNQREPSPEVKAAREKAEEARRRYEDLKKSARVNEPTAYFREIAAKVRAAEKHLKDLHKKIASGDLSVADSKDTPSHPVLDVLRGEIERLNKNIAEMRKNQKKANTANQPGDYFKNIATKIEAAEERIAELKDKISKGDLSKNAGSTAPTHPLLEAKRSEVKALNKALDKMRTAADAPAREIQKAANKLAAARKSVANLEAKLARGDLSTKPKKSVVVPADLQDARDKLKALNKEMAKARSAAKVRPSSEDIARKNYAARVQKKLADLRMRRLTNNFEPAKRKSNLVHDAKTQALQDSLNQELHEYNVDKERDRLAKRTTFEKSVDGYTGINRGFKLSRISTLAKLLYYTVQNLFTMPLKEATGGVLAHTPGLREISAGADIEGGFSAKAIAKFYGGFFGKGMKDALQTLSPILSIITRGKLGNALRRSDLKNAHDNAKTHLEPRWWDIPQVIHEAEKAPLRRGAFEYAKQKLTEAAVRDGKDPATDPALQKDIERRAYEHSDRVVLMADNKFANALNKGIRWLETPDKNTKEIRPRGKVGAALARTVFTFNKVAANHFVEFFNHAFGLPIGAMRAALAKVKGIDTIHPDDLNSIMRQIKAGTPGAAMLTLGMLAPGIFGGLNPSRKKKGDEPGFGEVKIGDTIIPHNVSHATPYLLVAQLGATIAHTMHEKLRRKDADTQSAGEGVMSAMRGISRTGPVVSELSRITKLLDEHQGNNAVAEWLRNNLEPGLLSEAAEYFDKDMHDQTIKRKAQSWLDEVKIGIPGLRQDVPQAKK